MNLRFWLSWILAKP